MAIFTDEARNEPDGQDGVDNDSEDVQRLGSVPQIEQTEHENDDDAGDQRAPAAAFELTIVMFVDAHI